MQLFPVRAGRLDERRSVYLEGAEGDPGELIVSFLADYYAAQVGVPPLDRRPRAIEDVEVLEGVPLGASRRAGRGARRGAGREAPDARARRAQRRARAAARGAAAAAHARPPREALEELREALDLEALPVRIECFDISNLGETKRVASMVVFEEGVPRKRSDYRQFGIRSRGGQDDFRSIAEAVRRRFARYRLVEEEGYDRGFATLPNLVVIDGGKGQLRGARGDARVRPAPGRGRSLAKREEEVFVPGRSQPVRLQRDSPGGLLLQRIRDEAHRFAIASTAGRRNERHRLAARLAPRGR